MSDNNNTKTLIEIGGVPMQVDMAQVQKVTEYKVGDGVKLLKKQYGGTWRSFPGMIVGFDNFKNRPTIIVAYIVNEYSVPDVQFEYLNADNADVEICPANQNDVPVHKTNILSAMDAAIRKKGEEIEDLKRKKQLIEDLFGQAFPGWEAD